MNQHTNHVIIHVTTATIQQDNILIDAILFTFYSIILTILFGIWTRTIFGSNMISSSKNMHRKRISKTVNKSCTNMSTAHILHALNDKCALSISPNHCLSHKLPSPKATINKKTVFNTPVPISPHNHDINVDMLIKKHFDSIPKLTTIVKTQNSNTNITTTTTTNDLNEVSIAIGIAINDKKQKKEIKLEPVLKIIGTASIFFAVLYVYLN
eukprot:430837_1